MGLGKFFTSNTKMGVRCKGNGEETVKAIGHLQRSTPFPTSLQPPTSGGSRQSRASGGREPAKSKPGTLGVPGQTTLTYGSCYFQVPPTVPRGAWADGWILHAGSNPRPKSLFLCGGMYLHGPRVLLTKWSSGFTFYSVSIPQVLVEVSLCSTSLSVQVLGNYRLVCTVVARRGGTPRHQSAHGLLRKKHCCLHFPCLPLVSLSQLSFGRGAEC